MGTEDSHVPFKSWDDIRNAFDDIRKRGTDWFPWHADILPRYKSGRLSVHLHIVYTRNGERDGVCLECWVIGRKVNNELSPADFPNRDKWKAVLVDVYEGVKSPQRAIQSVVRLNRLDISNGRCGNLVLLKTIKTFSEPLSGDVNRKVGSIFTDRRPDEFSPAENSGQFPNNVIEGSTGISKAVPDNAAKFGLGVLGDFRQDSGQISVILYSDLVNVAFQVPSNIVFESIQMFLCPDDFEPCSVERMRHG
jgi:hypothetical protein